MLQDEARVTYAGKIQKADGCIQWASEAAYIDRLWRAMQPWPGAYFIYLSMQIKVHALQLECVTDHKPGTVVEWGKAGLVIATLTHVVRVTSMQLPGKRAMTAQEIWAGKPSLFHVGDLL